MQLDASQAEFMAGLGKSPTGQQLKLLLEDAVREANENLRRQSGETLIRWQGKAAMLDELLASLNPKPPRHMRQVSGFSPEARGIEA